MPQALNSCSVLSVVACAAVATGLLGAGVARTAAGDDRPPRDAAPARAGAGPLAGPLAGPRAEPPGGPPGPSAAPDPSIVRRDLAGGVEPTPLSPEQAALEALRLSPEQRAAAEAVLLKRARILDDLVSKRLDELVKLGNAASAGDGADALAQLATMVGHATALTADGTLREQIERALPAEARAAFARVLAEYWRAVRTDTSPSRAKGGVVEVRLQSLGREVAAAFQRLLGSGALIKSYLTPELNLTPEQDARVGLLAEEFARTTAGAPSKAQETAFFLRLLAELTPEQQAKLIARVRAGGPGAQRPAPPAPAQPAPRPTPEPAAPPQSPPASG